MPIHRTKNKDFFKKWSSEMAYVLGFFVADGNMLVSKRNTYYLSFQSTDRVIVYNIRSLLASNHKIGIKKLKNPAWKDAYTLQIGSKIMFEDLIDLGMTPRKSKTVTLPKVPNKHFQHFIRGYFDGDGNVNFCFYSRKSRNGKLTKHLQSGFVSGSKNLLVRINTKLHKLAKIEGGTLYSSKEGNYRLFYAMNDSQRLFNFMYKKIPKQCFLNRKLTNFKKAIEQYHGAVA